MADIQIIENIQTKPKGIVQSMFDAYGVLVNNPWALTVFIIGVLCIVSELHNSFGPLEMASNALVDYCKNSKSPLVPLANLLLQIINWIIPIKINFFISVFFVIPAIINNTVSSWIASLIFVCITIFTNISTLELFLFSQFYLMYSFVDNYWYKFIIFFFSFVFLIIGLSAFSNMVGMT